MKIRKIKITRCFECDLHREEPHIYQKCKKREKLPRKKKKLMKELLRYNSIWFEFGMDWCLYPASCDIQSWWNKMKFSISELKWVKKHFDTIAHIYNVCSDNLEPVSPKKNGGLSWCWEGDNGLYTESGTMPFAYEDLQDGTWAYSETMALVDMLGVSKVSSDKELVEAVYKRNEVFLSCS